MKNRKKNNSEIVPPFYYSIVAPEKFRPNTDYELNCTIHSSTQSMPDQPLKIRVSIQDANDQKGFKVVCDFDMKANVTETLKIPIGDVSPNRKHKLVVTGLSGITAAYKVPLHLQTHNHFIIIETDKKLYKTTDCLKFRVLVLDADLKAADFNKNALSVCLKVSFFSKNIIFFRFKFSCTAFSSFLRFSL